MSMAFNLVTLWLELVYAWYKSTYACMHIRVLVNLVTLLGLLIGLSEIIILFSQVGSSYIILDEHV